MCAVWSSIRVVAELRRDLGSVSFFNICWDAGDAKDLNFWAFAAFDGVLDSVKSFLVHLLHVN